MKYLFYILLIPVLLCSNVLSVNAQEPQQVSLEGFRHNPPVATPGTGVLEVTFRADTLIVSGEFSNLRGPYWAAGVYYGTEDENGNRLYSLHATVNEERTGGKFSAEENKLVLRPAIIEALGEGRLYLNISSSRFKQGEIRGQIPPMN